MLTMAKQKAKAPQPSTAAWLPAARKLGAACRGAFIRVIKHETRDDKAPLVFGDDTAASAAFDAALRGGAIARRVVLGIGGEVEIFEVKN